MSFSSWDERMELCSTVIKHCGSIGWMTYENENAENDKRKMRNEV